MGNTLVVGVLPDEVFMPRNLVEPIWNEQIGNVQYVRIRDQYDVETWNALLRDRPEILRRHPQAVWRVGVGFGDVWQPPMGDAPDEVRRALAAFLEAKLARFAPLLGAGRFVLDIVRAIVKR